jgi:hypothetical protein
MQPKVFTRHSAKDKAIADAICHQLESEGIKCWIAPRDIEPGSKWTEAIMHGIEKCRAFIQYRADINRDLRQIASALGVAHMLEGTWKRPAT